jgi:hypothetical protein
MLALCMLTMVVSGESAAAQPQPTAVANLASSSVPGSTGMQLIQQAPAHSLPDLIVGFFRWGDDLEPGEEFGVATIVKNEGSGTAKPVRVVVLMDRAFTNLRVSDAPGFTCAVETQAVICRGGQIAEGNGVAIGVGAKAPRTPGDYDMIALVDPQGAVDERDENNNSDRRTFHVRGGH